MKILKCRQSTLIIFCSLLFSATFLDAQKMGINTSDVPNDVILNIEGGGTKGFLPPKVTSANRPSSPTVGNTIYNTTVNSYQVWNGSSWSNLGTPRGAIIMWNGSTAPAGWAICNGSNGTPDLRNRFIVSTGTSYGLGATGGASTVTLTTAQMPSHSHGVGTLTTTSEGSHSHGLGSRGVVLSCVGCNSGNVADGSTDDSDIGNTKSAGAHTHSITGNTGSEGSGSAHENKPPYYALTFIMKL